MIRDAEFDVADEPKDYWGWVQEGRYDSAWKMMDAYLKPEHTFLDLGAWIGSHSLYASRIAKRVIAVEPDPVAYAILRKNVNHAYSPIETIEAAITGSSRQLKMGSGFLGASTTRVNANAGGGIGAWEPEHTFSIWGTTLRKFFEAHHLEDPLFIKMDVEGSEEDILEDMEFFEEHKPIVHLEQHPWWWSNESQTTKRVEQLSKITKVLFQ